MVSMTYVCLLESRFSPGVALVSLFIYLLFVWFYKDQGNRGSEGLWAAGPSTSQIRAYSHQAKTKKIEEASKNKRQFSFFSLMLVCYSLIDFCLSFGLFRFRSHFRLVWIGPYTASRMKVPVGYGQWSDTVTRRFVFIMEHYVTEPNSFTLETITVPSLTPCRNCTIFWRVWE